MTSRVALIKSLWKEFKQAKFEPLETPGSALASHVGFLLEELNHLTLNEYQAQAMKYAFYPKEHAVTYTSLAVANEAGELAGEAKKMLRDDKGTLTPDRIKRMKKEAGDVLWELQAFCYELGFSLEEVARENLEKLADRKERDKLKGSGDDR